MSHKRVWVGTCGFAEAQQRTFRDLDAKRFLELLR
jgi:hypothetical protein